MRLVRGDRISRVLCEQPRSAGTPIPEQERNIQAELWPRESSHVVWARWLHCRSDEALYAYRSSLHVEISLVLSLASSRCVRSSGQRSGSGDAGVGAEIQSVRSLLKGKC